MRYLIFFSLMVFSSMLFGEIPDPPEKLPGIIDLVWYAFKNYPSLIGEAGAFLLALLTFLRGLGELLNYVATRTSDEFDDKIVVYITQIVKWMAKILIWFGIGNGKR